MENTPPSTEQQLPVPASSESPELVEGLFRFEPRPRRLGEVMVDLGMVSAEDVAEALEEQKDSARMIGEILVARGSASPADVARARDAQEVLASPLWDSLGRFRWKKGLGITHLDETHRKAIVLSMGERHVQLSPEEFALAEGLVEEDRFGSIARRCWEETGQLVWPEQLLTLTTRLWMLGMIDVERAAEEAALPPPDLPPPSAPLPASGGWGRWVQIRIPLHDPSHLLERTVPLGRFLFSRTGLVLVTLLVTLAAGVLSVRGGSLWTLVVGNVTHRWVGGVGSFIVAMLLSSIVHEYGHAMACRAFGGRVRRMGIMLYVLAPMAYCDVSDAHRFADKRLRMIVGAAGIYVQLAFASLAAIAWAWLPLPPIAAMVLAQLVAVTMVSTLANLNPLLKLDGYYILTDWLEIPNFRSRAFAALDARVKRAFGKTDMPTDAKTPRERRAFIWYGLLGGIYTVGIAGYMTWMLSHLALRALSLE